MITLKKLFFFYIFFSILTNVSASSLQELKVLNGTLSREFEPTNNLYSVDLFEGENTLKIAYQLENEEDLVSMNQEEEKVVLTVTSNDTQEEYVFYLNKNEAKPVFKQNQTIQEEKKEIPYLKYYVIGSCFLIILFLFKVIVIGFKK